MTKKMTPEHAAEWYEEKWLGDSLEIGNMSMPPVDPADIFDASNPAHCRQAAEFLRKVAEALDSKGGGG